MNKDRNFILIEKSKWQVRNTTLSYMRIPWKAIPKIPCFLQPVVWLRSTSTLGVRVQGEIKLQLYKIPLLVEQLVRHTHISDSHLMSFSNARIPPFSHASPLPPSSQKLKYYFTHQKMSIPLHSTTLHIHACPHPPRTTLSESEEWFYCGISCKL